MLVAATENHEARMALRFRYSVLTQTWIIERLRSNREVVDFL